MEKKRDMNFELLRIIAMILIICSHYMGHGGIYGNVTRFHFNYYFIEVISAFTRISVNVYVMITGYYMVTSSMKVKKLFNIWIVVWFYSVLSLLIPIILKDSMLSKDEIKMALMPFSSAFYWFPTAYIALYAISPFINKLVRNLTKKQYLILISILFALLVVQKTIFNNNSIIDANNGVSFIWCVYLYIVAGYIRLHYNGKVNKVLCLLTTLIISFIIVAIRTTTLKNSGEDITKLWDFSNILNFISTITIFLFFKELKIKNETCSKIIGKISPLTFGIYLIHENYFVYERIYTKILFVQDYYGTIYLPIHMIVSVIWIFTMCALIEKIRMEIFAILGKSKISKKIDEKLDQINEKFNNVMREQV